MEMKKSKLAIGAVTGALLSLVGMGAVASPAQAASSYWQPTAQVNRGSCTGTFQIKAGLYGQACTRLYSESVTSATFKNYLVVTNTGTSKEIPWVRDSTEHGDIYAHDSSLLKWYVEGSKDVATGQCYATAIYSKQSLTCESSTATFSYGVLGAHYVRGYGKIHLVVSGQDKGVYESVAVNSA